MHKILEKGCKPLRQPGLSPVSKLSRSNVILQPPGQCIFSSLIGPSEQFSCLFYLIMLDLDLDLFMINKINGITKVEEYCFVQMLQKQLKHACTLVQP